MPSHNIRGAEQPHCESLVDDRDAWRLRVVIVRESAPGEQMCSSYAEIPGRNFVELALNLEEAS